MKILKFKNKQKFKYSRKIIIKDLILLISVGIHQFEKLKKQKVKFNIEITTDPNLKPDIKSIINYESVINDVKKLTKKTHFELLESLSESIFDEIFKNKKLKKIKLKIEKLEIIKKQNRWNRGSKNKNIIDILKKGKKIIKDKISFIPKNPGVYKMLSSTGEILYIGKAKNIPNRLKSYVTDSNLPIRTERMLSLTHNLETTTTNNESEALLLEASLIKKHKPRYNILLRDDKSFPISILAIKTNGPINKARGKKSRSGYYFGPFASIGSAIGQ